MTKEELLKQKELIKGELNKLLKKKEREDKIANSFFKTYMIVDAIVSLSVVSALSTVAFNGEGNPFSLNKKTPVYTTETVDNYQNPVIVTQDTQKRDIKNSINIQFFDQWVKEEDHYSRNVTSYEIDGDEVLKDYYKNNIETITESDIEKYKNTYSYTEEYFNVSEAELNTKPYVRMSATYESGEAIIKETPMENIPDIAGTLGLSVFLWFANIYLLHCGLDQASKSKKKKKSTETLISEKEILIAEIDFKLNDKKEKEILLQLVDIAIQNSENNEALKLVKVNPELKK